MHPLFFFSSFDHVSLCHQFASVVKYGFKITLKSIGFSDIQYFTLSTRVYVLSNNVWIDFVFYVLRSYMFLTGSRIYIVTRQNIVFLVLDS